MECWPCFLKVKLATRFEIKPNNQFLLNTGFFQDPTPPSDDPFDVLT